MGELQKYFLVLRGILDEITHFCEAPREKMVFEILYLIIFSNNEQ